MKNAARCILWIVWMLLIASAACLFAGCTERPELDMLNAGCTEESRVDTGRTSGNTRVGFNKIYRVTFACPATKRYLEVTK